MASIEAQMLIRKSVSVVFQAFIDPAVTTQFWFTRSTGKLEAGKTVTWDWEMFGATMQVEVKEIIPNKKIATVWGDPATNVDYLFTELSESATYVVIKNYNINLSGDELIQAVQDLTGGFTTVLDNMKAYLEFNIRLNLIADKFPREMNPEKKDA